MRDACSTIPFWSTLEKRYVRRDQRRQSMEASASIQPQDAIRARAEPRKIAIDLLSLFVDLD
jgi:hypothetical protein